MLRGRERRGVAVLVVLLLISMTLALSYAMVQTQFTATRIQKNSSRRGSAQQAALTGLTMAIKKMHQSDWSGADTSLSGSLGSTESFTVTYTTGDALLAAGSPDYAEYPFRVTLLATGYSADPDNPQNIATYSIRAVVRLVPRKLSDEPADWAAASTYTVYQWTEEDWSMAVPSRIEGPVYVRGTMSMSRELSWYDDARQRYYTDLNPVRTAYGWDWRPYTAQVSLCYSRQWWDTTSLLSSLGITRRDIGWPASASLPFPEQVSTYRLYTGGKQYTATAITASLQDTTLQADVLTNPLGIFYVSGDIEIRNNVAVRGMFISTRASRGDVTVRGQSVSFNPVTLPALYGSSQAMQLPVLAAGDDLRILTNARAIFNGLVIVPDVFDVASDPSSPPNMTLIGGLVVGELAIHPRSEWNRSGVYWDSVMNNFQYQLGRPGAIPYFPDYLRQRAGLDPVPRIVMKPNPTPVRYHWHNWNNPIFVAEPSDGGLRWELVSWTDCP